MKQAVVAIIQIILATLVIGCLWSLADPLPEPLCPIVRLTIGVVGACWINYLCKDYIESRLRPLGP